MAAGSLPAPGTKYGPCVPTCTHKDCAGTRAQSEMLCRFCAEPIGYERAFYREDTGLVHAVCLETEILEKGGES